MVTWGILGEGVSLLIGMQNPRGNQRIFTDPLGGGLSFLAPPPEYASVHERRIFF